jgi:hypothetical protein
MMKLSIRDTIRWPIIFRYSLLAAQLIQFEVGQASFGSSLGVCSETLKPSFEPVPEPEMTHEVDLSLFVPCFNEETRVVATIRTIEAAMAELGCSYEICRRRWIDDNTFQVISEYAKSNPEAPLRLHSNPLQFGLGTNLRRYSLPRKGRILSLGLW